MARNMCTSAFNILRRVAPQQVGGIQSTRNIIIPPKLVGHQTKIIKRLQNKQASIPNLNNHALGTIRGTILADIFTERAQG